ncbi:MAG: hypothetical protein ACQERX_02135 [Bacillota bacterium]
MKLKIDGKKFEFNDQEELLPEFDNFNNSMEQDIKEPTELGEVIRDLNNDTIERETKMSGIDMRSRLHEIEVSSILAVDTLVSFNFLPLSCLPFTRQKKRLAVSLDGKGRDDIVKIVSGKREMDEKMGGGSIMSGIANKFSGGNK